MHKRGEVEGWCAPMPQLPEQIEQALKVYAAGHKARSEKTALIIRAALLDTDPGGARRVAEKFGVSRQNVETLVSRFRRTCLKLWPEGFSPEGMKAA